MGAPVGNQNAAKAKVWTAAIERALERRSRVEQREALDAIADKLLELASDGDLAALKELGDRLEGKPAQSVGLSTQDGPLRIGRIERVIVDPRAAD